MTLSDQYLGACRLRGKDVSKFISKWITPTTHSKQLQKLKLYAPAKYFYKTFSSQKTLVSTSSKSYITIANLKDKLIFKRF